MIKWLLCFCLFSPAALSGQVYKMKVYKTILSEYDGKEWKEKETNKVEFLAVLNFDKDKIRTYGKEYTDFDVVKTKSKEIKENGDVVSLFEAIDQKGRECELTFYLFSKKRQDEEGSPVASFAVRYEEILLIFYMKKDE